MAGAEAEAAGATEAGLIRRADELLRTHPPATTPMADFLGAQFDAGLAWVHFPEGFGGLGAPVKLQSVVERRLAAAGAPSGWAINTTAYGQGAATIVAFGTEAQRTRYLRPIFTCEEIWCQLFSEPGAGSDLAGLATRAVRDGDEWVVDGQKVWTTRGHLARFALLLARTDPDVPKHAGLTYFVLDMHQPGVTVRPLRQLDGEEKFNSVYLDAARVPDHERLGEVGEGWKVSTATLANERYNFGGMQQRGGGPIAGVVDAWRRRPAQQPGAGADPRHDAVLRRWEQAEVQRLTTARATEARELGRAGPESAIGKLAGTELTQRLAELAVDLLGAEGTLLPAEGGLQKALLSSRSSTIAGGTSDIQRNIIGERVLGLPREPDATKGRPWSEIPHS
jgi:alkylation response protein AidB-like acyl-CoA dehydrogenase